MTPAGQVKAGSFGAIVNVQHLTAAGAARIPTCLARGGRLAAGKQELRLQVGGHAYGELRSGQPGVAQDFSAAFGSMTVLGGPGSGAEIGFVDLTRTTLEAAAALAAAGLGPDGPRDGLVVVVEPGRVTVAPLPERAVDLAAHLKQELTDPPARPTVDLLHQMCAPMLAEARRVPNVRVPGTLMGPALTEWGGPGLNDAFRRAWQEWDEWEQAGRELDRPDQGAREAHQAAQPPLPLGYQVGLLRVGSTSDDDIVRIWSEKGPVMAAERWHDEIPTLAANPAWTGSDERAEQVYRALRGDGVSAQDAVAVLPQMLA